MEAKFVVLTNPENYKLVETAPVEFYAVLQKFFHEKFTAKNTLVITHSSMSRTKLHVFQGHDYVGWVQVIPEDCYYEPPISSQH